MPLTPSILIRQAYARIGAFTGTAAQISTAYTGSLANLNTESFPLQSMYDRLTVVEGEIATAVAFNINSTQRRNIADTVGVTSGGQVPSVGDSGASAKIIGVWGQVRDAGTSIELTPNLHLDEIRAIVNSDVFISSYYSYVYAPPRFYATVTSAIIDVCVYDVGARQTAISADGALLFPQCEGAYFSGLMSGLKNEDASLQGLSAQFDPAYQAWLQSLNPAPKDLVGEAAA